jgi:hypothetical protein
MNAQPDKPSDRSWSLGNYVFGVLAVAATAWAWSGVSMKDAVALLFR